jgi:hypothetical protein
MMVQKARVKKAGKSKPQKDSKKKREKLTVKKKDYSNADLSKSNLMR